MKHQPHRRLALLSISLMATSQLVGCINQTTPALDATFGNSVRATRQAQTINLGPPEQSDPTQGLDAKAAVNLIERYQDSYKSPPKTFEVLNLGGAVSGQ